MVNCCFRFWEKVNKIPQLGMFRKANHSHVYCHVTAIRIFVSYCMSQVFLANAWSIITIYILIHQQKHMTKNRSFWSIHVGVSLNGGTPNHPFLIGFSIINHPFWVPLIFGNTYVDFNRFLWRIFRGFLRSPMDVPGAWSLPPGRVKIDGGCCRYQKVDYFKGSWKQKTICRDGYPSTFQVVWDTSTDPVTKVDL